MRKFLFVLIISTVSVSVFANSQITTCASLCATGTDPIFREDIESVNSTGNNLSEAISNLQHNCNSLAQDYVRNHVTTFSNSYKEKLIEKARGTLLTTVEKNKIEFKIGEACGQL